MLPKQWHNKTLEILGMHAKRARHSLQWHNTWANRVTENIFKYSQTHDKYDDDDDAVDGTMEKLSLLFAIHARSRRKMRRCELYRVIARRNRRISISPCSQKLATEKCPATIDAVAVWQRVNRIELFNFRCCPWSSTDETSARRTFFFHGIRNQKRAHALLQNWLLDSEPFGIHQLIAIYYGCLQTTKLVSANVNDRSINHRIARCGSESYASEIVFVQTKWNEFDWKLLISQAEFDITGFEFVGVESTSRKSLNEKFVVIIINERFRIYLNGCTQKTHPVHSTFQPFTYRMLNNRFSTLIEMNERRITRLFPTYFRVCHCGQRERTFRRSY